VACAKYGTGKKYGTGVYYCSSVSARGLAAIFFDATCQTLSVEVLHDGFFQLDTIKAEVQDAKYVAFGYGVFPDLASTTFLSVEVRASGAFALDAIRPVVRVLRKQPFG
jgi:hypothetical protein